MLHNEQHGRALRDPKFNLIKNIKKKQVNGEMENVENEVNCCVLIFPTFVRQLQTVHSASRA